MRPVLGPLPLPPGWGCAVSGWVRACNFGDCAEVMLDEGDIVRVRSSRMPSEDAPFTVAEWRQFLVDVKAGRFDDVAPAADHDDHDVHGPVIEVWPDGRTTVDPDCGCPPDCEGCEREGVSR